MPYSWTLADKNLHAEYWDDGRWNVLDRRCGKTWNSLPLEKSSRLENVVKEDHRLSYDLTGSPGVRVTVELTTKSELHFTLTGDPALPLDRFSFPAALQMPAEDHYLLQTDGAGLLLKADDTVYPVGEFPFFYCGGGASMSWIGVTDAALQAGYMAIFETPFDAAIRTARDAAGWVNFAPVWLPSMGALGAARKIRYVFFDRGGYVAQCKTYRDYIWPKNKVVTLRENAKRFPAIAKMLGAVHIYVWDGAREVAFAERLKAAGIEKAMLLWNPNHTPYPEKNYDERLKAIGYATGAYELFTDIHPDSHPGYTKLKQIPLKRNTYPGLYEAIRAVKEDGGSYSNVFGTYICPQAVRPELIARVEKELTDYPHETYFLDVYQANGVYECHSPSHPLTREGYANAIIANMELLQDKYGLFLGGEWGGDFSGSRMVFAHGMMTLQRTFFDSENGDRGTIYYMGDWSNNPRPSVMLGARVAPESYLRFSINEKTRAPLYELVYHDAVLTSWRWEDCSHHNPEIWWKKDLFNLLYGTAPLWSVDQDRWAEYEASFVKSYEKICPWLQEICHDEMISHRFVTADRKVQETQFSSGKTIMVNFGDETYVEGDRKVPARGFLAGRI